MVMATVISVAAIDRQHTLSDPARANTTGINGRIL
jgi:hypothetical protein